MLREIRTLQIELQISDAELLGLARRISGTVNAYDCGEIRCVEDMLGVEQSELLDELRAMAEPLPV